MFNDVYVIFSQWILFFFYIHIYFPDEFRSKEACENKKIELKCNPNSRVAVYSASYGRTEHENLYCPQPQGVSEESTYYFNLQNKKKCTS